MEEQRTDSQSISVSAGEGMDRVFVFGCPYLGTLEDSDTSLAYPAPANHCFRTGSANAIELGHQEAYCLSDQHHTCHVFRTAEAANSGPMLERKAPKKRKRRASLYALPLILVLILLAAIIWWPAPGTTIQDSLVRGAQNLREVSGGVGLTANPDAGSLEADEPVTSAEVSSADDSAQPTGLTGDTQRQGTGENETLSAPDDRQDGAAGAALANTSSVNVSDTEEKQTAVASAEEAGEQDAVTTEPDNQLLAGSLESAEAPAGDETHAIVDYEAEAISEQTAAESAAEVAHSVPADASATDNYESVESNFAEFDETVLEEPDIEAVEQIAETAESDEAEESKSVYTSDLPVISTEVAPVASPPVQSVPVSGTGERVALVGPAASSALSLGANSGETKSLLVYEQAGPGAIVTELENKQFVTILGRDTSGLWLNVRLQDGREGWINIHDSGAAGIAGAVAEAPVEIAAARPVVAATSYPVVRSAYVDTGALNLRTGPGVEYEAFTIIGKGQIVGLIGRRALGPWVRVRLDDGTEGWVNSSLLAPFS